MHFVRPHELVCLNINLIEILVSFTGWAGIIAAQLLGYLLGDRIPLWASRWGGGIWHPEYRLWNMMIPGLLCKFVSSVLIKYSQLS